MELLHVAFECFIADQLPDVCVCTVVPTENVERKRLKQDGRWEIYCCEKKWCYVRLT